MSKHPEKEKRGRIWDPNGTDKFMRRRYPGVDAGGEYFNRTIQFHPLIENSTTRIDKNPHHPAHACFRSCTVVVLGCVTDWVCQDKRPVLTGGNISITIKRRGSFTLLTVILCPLVVARAIKGCLSKYASVCYCFAWRVSATPPPPSSCASSSLATTIRTAT